MEFKDLVGLYFERTNAMQTYWNFYITVILALVAFFGSAKPSPNMKFLAVALSLAFAGFAFVNHSALVDVTEQRLAAKALLEEAAKRPAASGEAVSNAAVFSSLEGKLNPPTARELTLFHVVGDIFTLAGIWFLASRKSKET